MKIKSLSLTSLQNEEHYKFLSDVNGLISIFTAASLLIVAEYASFQKLYSDEGEALNFVRKSNYSDQLHAADTKLNDTLNSIDHAICSGLKHYIPAVKDASIHLNLLWEANGNITNKAQKNKSGAIKKLIAELRGPYSQDVMSAGLDGWVNQLDMDLMAYDTVENSRYDEKEEKTHLRMKEVRKESDATYHTIIEKINALMIVNGEAPYLDFVNKLNLRIDSYANNLALRNGKGKKPTDTATPEA